MSKNNLILRPLYLIPHYNVEVKWDNLSEDHARVEVINQRTKSYRITINKQLSMKLFINSLLNKTIPFEHFLAGLMYHEVGHILYDSFGPQTSIQTQLMHYILNVLLDAQLEYHFSKDFPESATFLRYALLVLKRDADMKMLQVYREGQKLIDLKHTFYYLARFGSVMKNSDEEFVHFLLPLLLSAQRNDAQNVYDAAEAIYEYFFASVENKQLQNALEKSVISILSPMTKQDVDAIEDADELVVSSIKATLEEAQNDLLAGKGIGEDGPEIQIVEEEDAYFRQVVTKHKNGILVIRNAFKRVLNEVQEVSAYDGELDIHQQQQAYIDSFTGDENEIYQVQQFASRSIDHLLIRDISGSTSSFEDEYAEGSIILHAAIQGFKEIRDAHIDFSTNSIVLLEFDKDLKTARIHPRSETSTNLAPAYRDALMMKWQSKKKLITVLTDGGISPGYQGLERQLKSMGIKIKKWHVGPPEDAEGDVQVTSIDRFPYDVAKYILREI